MEKHRKRLVKAYPNMYSAPQKCKVWYNKINEFITCEDELSGEDSDVWHIKDLAQLYLSSSFDFRDYVFCYFTDFNIDVSDDEVRELCVGDVIKTEDGRLWSVGYGICGYELVNGVDNGEVEMDFMGLEKLWDIDFEYMGHGLEHPELLEEE